MNGQKYAVLIASSEFDDPKLKPLQCPLNDVAGLARVLRAPEMGGFTVAELPNRPAEEVKRKINEVLSRAGSNDFVLLYYAGHGKPGGKGRLYLATKDTDTSLLPSTSVDMNAIKGYLEESDCPNVAIILDCCYSGLAGRAFARGGIEDQLQAISNESGTYILCAAGETQIAVEKEGDEYGLLTKHIIRGIETGEADKEGDGVVQMNELFDYVYDAIKREGGGALPVQFSSRQAPKFEISRTGRKPREERRQKLKQFLSKLNCDDQILPDKVYTEALSIIARKVHELGPSERRLDGLLDRLLAGQVTISDFVQQWYETGPGKEEQAAPSCDAGESDDEPDESPAPPETDDAPALPTSYEHYATLRGHGKLVWSVGFSPDGSLLASGSKDNTIRIWGTDGGHCRHVLRGHENDVNCVRFSPDGRLLASASDDYTVRLWQIPEGHAVHVLKGHTYWVRSVDFGPRNTLASGGEDGTVRVWNIDSGKEEIKVAAHRYAVYCVVYSPDRRFLASTGKDNNAVLWDATSLKSLCVMSAHTGRVRCAAFSADGNMLATVSDDKMVRLWDVPSGEPLASFGYGHVGRIRKWLLEADTCVAFRPDYKLLATADDLGVVFLYHVLNVLLAENELLAQQLRATAGFGGDPYIRSVAFSPDGSVLAAGCASNVWLWRVTGGGAS